MFENIDIVQLLADLLCVKLPSNIRKYLFLVRDNFDNSGCIQYKDQDRLRDIAFRYRIKLKELYAAREKARISNGLRSLGISRVDFKKRIDRRVSEDKIKRSDVGF